MKASFHGSGLNENSQAYAWLFMNGGGERGIRTPGPSQVNGFQDRRNRPLCQLSAAKIQINFILQTFFAIFLKFYRKNAEN